MAPKSWFMSRQKTDLPSGDAFSPKQIDLENADLDSYDIEDQEEELPALLDLAEKYENNPDKFDEAIEDLFISNSDRAFTVRTGMGQNGYQILDDDFEFTELGEELLELRDNADELYDRFAQHILLERHGYKGIRIINDLEAQGKKTINDNIKDEFRKQYDFHINETANDWSQMRAWMSKAGFINTNTQHFKIDHSKIEELIGVNSDTVLELDSLDAKERAFLRALALVNPDGKIKNSVIKQIAEDAYDVDISQSKISNNLLDPLEEKGFIEWEHVDGKANWIELGDRFDADVLKPVLEDISERSGVPRQVLRKSFSELFDDMDSDSTYQKGVALETFAIKLGRMLGLEFVGWRVRGRETGDVGEVDVVMDQIGLTYSRIQIQCKNIKGNLQTKHVAREVGISRMLQTNTILMVARGGVTTDARRFANRIMQEENMSIVFLEVDDIENLDDNPNEIHNLLRGKSRQIHNYKQLGERDMVEEEEDDDEYNRDKEQDVLEEYESDIQDATEEDTFSLSDFGD